MFLQIRSSFQVVQFCFMFVLLFILLHFIFCVFKCFHFSNYKLLNFVLSRGVVCFGFRRFGCILLIFALCGGVGYLGSAVFVLLR
jgi:hypothetical protein